MNSRLTVLECDTLLRSEVTNDPASTKFLNWLNEVCERYILSGKWKGAAVTAVFDSSAGYITLPSDFYSVLAMRYDRYPGSPVYSQYHPYMEFGVGEVDDTLKWPGFLIDMGDGFSTQTDIVEPGILKVYSSASDDGLQFLISGVNATTGREVFDASGVPIEEVVLASPSATTTVPYSRITGIQKPVTNGYVTLSVVPTNGDAEYQIGVYKPSETNIVYRRYQTGVAEDAIKVLCQRRFMTMRSDYDWVIPGNLTALRYGLKAMKFEEAQDFDSAQKCFQLGLSYLNAEAKSSRGGVQPDMNFSLFGTSHAFPWAN